MYKRDQEPVPYVVQVPLPSWVVITLILMGLLILGMGYALFIRTPTPGATVYQGGVAIQPTPSGPAPTPVGRTREATTEAVITVIKTVSRLETKEYTIEDDATKIREPAFLAVFGGESIQAHVVGTVIGRTDLAKLAINPDLRSGSVTLSEDGKQISIVLPCSEVTNPIIDWDRTQFPAYSSGFFSKPDPGLWAAAMKVAASKLVERAKRIGIQAQANQEAQSQMRALIGLGGQFKEIFIQTGAC